MLAKRLTIFFFFLGLLFLGLTVNAQEEETDAEKEKPKEPLQYYAVHPKLLSLYQSSDNRLHYVSIEVQIVVRGDDNYLEVETHLPLIQDAMSEFLHNSHADIVEDLTRRDELRALMTAKVSEILKAEIKKDVIEDLLFTQYLTR